jgi:hypothetical protein
MGGLFGPPDYLICCCGTPAEVCDPCPPGTIYPWLVDVTFPDIGVSQPAGNEFDPEEDGETTFRYRVEGSYGGYSFQCLFGECEVSISIIRDSDGASICLGGGATVMTSASCPPDPLILVYTVECSNGSTISVVITG